MSGRSALVFAALLTVSSHAAAEFVQPFGVVLRPGTAGVDAPQLALGADDRVVYLWLSGGAVERRVMQHDGALGTVTALPRLSASDATQLAAVTDALGRVHAVWRENGKIVHHRLTANGALGISRLLSSADASNAELPALAADAFGGVVVVWARGSRIEAVRLAASDALPIAPVAEMSPGHQSLPPGVAIDGTGEATVVWRRQGKTEYRRLGLDGQVASVVIPADNGVCNDSLPRVASHPQSPVRPFIVYVITDIFCSRSVIGVFADGSGARLHLSSAGGMSADPGHRVAVAPDGTANVAWQQDTDSGTQILRSRVGSDGNIIGAALVSTAGGASEPDIAVGPGGQTAVVWIEQLGQIERVRGRMVTAQGIGSSGPVLDLSLIADGEHPTDPRAAVDPAGRASVAWRNPLSSVVGLRATQDVGPPSCASPLNLDLTATQTVAPAILVRTICRGWLNDDEFGAPPVTITQAPTIGSVQVFLGSVIYTANGNDYSESFAFRTSGPGGDSNTVTVIVNVAATSDDLFADGFEAPGS
ncbi:MAG TPA: hypothetical protein PKZ76_01275 [Xanthomonadaceae bacterium]|nr:hypothetical protein [Xanthomonadaceae bacterium]